MFFSTMHADCCVLSWLPSHCMARVSRLSVDFANPSQPWISDARTKDNLCCAPRQQPTFLSHEFSCRNSYSTCIYRMRTCPRAQWRIESCGSRARSLLMMMLLTSFDISLNKAHTSKINAETLCPRSVRLQAAPAPAHNRHTRDYTRQ